MDNKINARELVLDMLLDVVRNNTHSHVLIKNVLDKYNYIEEQEKAFIKRLFEGSLEREITLDYVINSFSNTPVNKMKPLIRCLMRMSVYQILFMDRIPDSAAINEAVKLAKKRKFVNLSGFVNGVLRKVASQKDTCLETDDLCVKYSVSNVIIDSLIKDYGIEKTEEILKASLGERHLFVRVCEELSDKDVETIKSEWDKENIWYRQLEFPGYAYELKHTEDIGRLNCFRQGMYTVQDVASMMVCEYANITAGNKVIDVCAAPGGKSLHAISKGAIVEARDVSDGKVALIEENKERMHADKLTTLVRDAAILDEDAIKQADIVIADVPCSGFGVMGRKPDIKRNITKQGLESLCELQKAIMDNVWQYAKVGGTLMYSTCTLRKAENDNMVEYLTDKYPLILEKMETLFPDENHDGFFIARLKRIG